MSEWRWCHQAILTQEVRGLGKVQSLVGADIEALRHPRVFAAGPIGYPLEDLNGLHGRGYFAVGYGGRRDGDDGTSESVVNGRSPRSWRRGSASPTRELDECIEPVEVDVEVDVGQDRRDHPALWCTGMVPRSATH